VLRKDLSGALQLLSYGALVDHQDSDGQTALHMAAIAGIPTVVKLLLCFGADADARDHRGKTADELSSSGVVRSLLRQYGKWEARKKTEKHRPLAEILRSVEEPKLLRDAVQLKLIKEKAAQKKPNSQALRLLSLDGGGIRGLVLIQILMELEDRLPSPLVNHIDWLGGTSTGAILALAIADGTSLRDCLRLYLRLKDEVFQLPPGGMRPYSAERIEHFLQQHFGPKRTLSELRCDLKVAVTATKAYVNPPELVLLRNYTFGMAGVRGLQVPGVVEPKGMEIWKAARMSR